MWYTFCPVICASHIALEKHWFQDEFEKDGINISHISTLPTEEWQSHFTHKHKLLFRDGGNIPPIWAKSEGADTKVIGMIWADRGQSIMVPKESPIKSVAELKGKKVALPRRTGNLIDFRRAMAQRGIIMALKAYGLTEDAVQWVDIPVDVPDIAAEEDTAPKKDGWVIAPKTDWKTPQEPEVEALRQGAVDAIYSSNGIELVLEREESARVLYTISDYPDWKYSVNINFPIICTVSTDFAVKHPDLVTRWMKVMLRAGIWAREHPDEVMAIMSGAAETELSAADLRRYYRDDFFMHLVPDLTDMGIEALEIEKNFLKEHGFINNDFDVKSWVDPSFLSDAVRESAINRI